MSERNDVIDGETNILPLFGSVAVFAKLASPLVHETLDLARDPAALQHSRDPFALNNHRVAGEPVDKAEEIIKLFVAIQFLVLCV